MAGAWDGPSTAVSLLLAAGGIVLAVAAAVVCHSEETAAYFFLIMAALCTVQLLIFAVTCFAYRSWVVTSVAAPRIGPGQDEPTVRRGLPALKSTAKSRVAGLDGWSSIVIAILVVPILVSGLAFLKPSTKLQFSAAQQEPIGMSKATPYAAERNGANKYTVAVYESAQLALQSKVFSTGNQNILLSNTASVALDVGKDRVYVPSHVAATCMYPEVLARNITTLVGSYSCTFKKGLQPACPPSDYSSGKNVSCVYISNSTGPVSGVTQQVMRYLDTELSVQCAVMFSLAQVDVTWRGDDAQYRRDGRGRDCYIADLTLLKDVPMTNKDWSRWPNYMDMLGDTTLQPLKLPLINSYIHLVSKERVRQSSDESLIDYFGAIFSAAAMVRTTGENFDPTESTQKVHVRYASKTCKQYGWSGFVIFLVVANALLLALCVAASSGVAMKQVSEVLAEGFGSICNKGARTTAPDSHMPTVPGSNSAAQLAACKPENSATSSTVTASANV